MFIELHFDSKPLLVSVAHITHVSDDIVGTAIYFEGQGIHVSESYEEVCSLIFKAGASITPRPPREAMKISDDFREKSKGPK